MLTSGTEGEAVKSSVVSNEPSTNETPPCHECTIRLVTVCGRISEARLARDRGVRLGFRHVRAKRMFQREGDRVAEVFTVYSGWAFRFRLLPDGRRQILTFFLPGDLVGVHSLDHSAVQSTVQAVNDVTLCAFDAIRFRSAASEDPQALRKFEEERRKRVQFMDELIIDLGRRSAQERIVRLILEFYIREKARNAVDSDSFEFPLRQEHLADALGLTVVHVSRTLASLRAQKLISLTRNVLTILDLPRLIALGALDKRQLASLHGEL